MFGSKGKRTMWFLLLKYLHVNMMLYATFPKLGAAALPIWPWCFSWRLLEDQPV